MFQILQKRKSTIGAKDIADLLAHLHTPIIYAYILFIGVLISLLAIPYVCCIVSCIKKNIDVIKYQCCFPVEVMFLTLFTVCLLLGIVGGYQITIQFQDTLMIFPVMCRNAMQDLLTNTNMFKTQVRSLVNTIENSSNLITNKTVSVPENLTDLFTVKLNPNLKEASLRINGNTFMGEVIFSRSVAGFIFNNNTVDHLVEVSMNELEQKIENIYRILDDLRENMTEYYINVYSINKYEMVGNDRIFLNHFQFPKWKIIYDNLQTLKKSLSAANKSLFFVDDLLIKMTNYSSRELNRVESATRNLQELSLVVERNITQAIKELLSPEMQDIITNATYKIDKYLSFLSISRNYQKMRFTNGSAWIMLIPTIYAFIGCVLLMIAVFTAAGDLKNIILNVRWSPSSSYTSYALTMFRISMTFSISFLWFLLILTIMFYCMYLPLSVFCEAVKDQKIFKNYVDEPKVWNNKTWLEYKLHNYIPQHAHLLKMRDVLNNCYHNRSLYASLNMQEYWNISQHFDAINMTINIDILQAMVAKAVQEIELPHEAMQRLIKKLALTEKNVDLHFVSAITRNVEKIQFNIQGKLAKTINDIPVNGTYSHIRMQLLELLNDVKLQTSSILRELSELENLKYYFKHLQNETISINNLVLNFSRIVNETSHIMVPTFLNSISLNINSMITEIRTIIQTSIENDIGNCYVVPFIYDKIVWSVCGHGLSLITGAWITFGLMSVSIFFCIIFSCRICGYIRGSKNHYYLWRQQLENQRYSSQTAKLNGTLLFDRSGNFMGSSITVKEQTEDKAV